MSVLPGLLASARRPRIVAILPAYNEEDVIASVIRDYLEDGVEVYLIDNCSTDGTVEVASEFLGQGLLRIERFPDDAGGSERAKKEYMWGEILRRNESLAAELGADWYIRADADEFREGPWPGLSHDDAITLVDALGYNAVQSRVLEFRPTDDSFPSGGDPREHIPYYERCDVSNSLWVKAWRQPPAGVHVDIAKTGGHEAGFRGRRVFPVHFISRHYPMRTSEHARRKIFKERLNRYPAEERAMGWHVHWDELAASDSSFLWDPAELVRWDRSEVCAHVLSEGAADLLVTTNLHGVTLDGPALYNGGYANWMGHACGAGAPFTQQGGQVAEQWMRQTVSHALQGRPFELPPDPLLLRAMMIMFDISVAHQRAVGNFHNSFLLEDVRATVAPRVADLLATTATATETPAPEAPRNAPCPCGSGLKFKKCHGLAKAA